MLSCEQFDMRYGPVPTGVASACGVELGLVEGAPDVLRNDRRLIRDVIEVRLRRRVEREDHLVRALERDVRERSAVHRPQRVEVERRIRLQRVEGV